jgi:hypothetical protein
MTSFGNVLPRGVSFKKRRNGIDDGAELKFKLVSTVVKVERV